MYDGVVTAVSSSPAYTFSKPNQEAIRPLAGLGVEEEQGNLIRKAGVMSIVLADGEVRPGDGIRVELPAEPYLPLERV